MTKLLTSFILVIILSIYNTFTFAHDRGSTSKHEFKWNSYREIEFVGLGNEIVFLFPEAAKHLPSEIQVRNHYKGTLFSSHSVLYAGGTLDNSDCVTPFKTCGVIPSGDGKFVPEFPEKVIGTSTFRLHIVTDELDKAFDALFKNDNATFLTESEKLSGRIVFQFSGILNFNNSLDHLKLAKDTISLQGYILWGNNGEEWNMAVTGGTGKYKNIQGEARFKRLTLVNAGGVSSFRIKLPVK